MYCSNTLRNRILHWTKQIWKKILIAMMYEPEWSPSASTTCATSVPWCGNFHGHITIYLLFSSQFHLMRSASCFILWCKPEIRRWLTLYKVQQSTFSPSPSLADEFDCSAPIGELRKLCFTWWVCVTFNCCWRFKRKEFLYFVVFCISFQDYRVGSSVL